MSYTQHSRNGESRIEWEINGIDIAGHLLELVLGPIFLLLHIPELNVAVGDVGQIITLLLAGDVNGVITRVVEGQFDVGTRTLTSLIGTVLWIALAASVLGDVGELDQIGELLELFG